MSIKSNTFNGDSRFERNVLIGGSARISGSQTVEHNLEVKGWLIAENIRSVCVGLFETEEDLNTAYPEPRDGLWGMVGTTVPADVYIAKNKAWIPTGETSGHDLLIIDSYNTRINQLIGDIIELKEEVASLRTKANDAENALAASQQALSVAQDALSRIDATNKPIVPIDIWYTPTAEDENVQITPTRANLYFYDTRDNKLRHSVVVREEDVRYLVWEDTPLRRDALYLYIHSDNDIRTYVANAACTKIVPLSSSGSGGGANSAELYEYLTNILTEMGVINQTIRDKETFTGDLGSF